MKVSGKRNPKGNNAPQRTVRGATTRTPSDDRPASAKPRLEKVRSDSEKIESRPQLAANRTKVKPVGKAPKRSRKAA